MRFRLYILISILPIFLWGQTWPQHVLNDHLNGPNFTQIFDVDGDGDEDIVTSAYFETFISWFPNIGNNNFGQQQLVANAGKAITTIHAVDLDNDGKKDIISASEFNNRVEWFKNLGNGNFGATQLISNAFIDPKSIASSDLNNDGWADVILSSSGDNTLSLFFNTGSGQFQSPVIITSTISFPLYIRLADLTNDGEDDLIVSTFGPNSVMWFRNTGNGAFDAGHIVNTTTFSPGHVNGVDWDNDGLKDIVFTGQNNKVAWLKNLGGGNFGSDQLITGSINHPFSIEAADYDADGDMDLVTGSQQPPHSIDVLRNSGSNGSFLHLQFGDQMNVSNYSCFAAIDNTPGMEVISNSGSMGKIVVFPNESNTFNSSNGKMIGSLSSLVISIVADDLDNNGTADIVAGSQGDGKIAWYKNLGNNVFSEQNVLVEAGTFTIETIARTSDLNGDGWKEVVAGMGNSLLYFTNQGSGNFDTASPVSISNAFIGIHDLICADTDLDGDTDVLVAGNTYGILVNNGNGTFLPPIFPGPGAAESICWADIDMDGLSDLITGNYEVNGQLKWHKNLGNNSFSTAQFISSIDYLTDIQVTDIDINGENELIVSSSTQNSVRVYQYNGNSTFSSPFILYSNPTGVKGMEIYDYDRDGDVDFLLSCGNHRIMLVENNRHFGFKAPVIIALDNVISPDELYAFDLDGDSDKELMCASTGNSRACWFGNLFSSARVTGKVYWDRNENGIYDGIDAPLSNYKIGRSNDTGFVFTNQYGDYDLQLFDLEDTLSVFPILSNDWSITSDSLEYQVIIAPTPLNYANRDFGIIPSSNDRKIFTTLVEYGFSCGDTSKLAVQIVNKGTTRTPGNLTLALDPNVSFQNASYSPDSVIGQTVYWSFDTLNYFDALNIQVSFTTSFGLSEGTLLTHTTQLFNEGILETTSVFTSEFTCIDHAVRKSVHPKGTASPGYISNQTEWMYYSVRFSDLTDGTVDRIMVEDFVSEKLEFSTLEVTSSSHDFTINFEGNRWLVARLSNSQVSVIEDAYINYRIRLKPNLVAGTEIKNSAWISSYATASALPDSVVFSNTTLNTINECPSIDIQIITATTVCKGEVVSLSAQNLLLNSVINWDLDQLEHQESTTFTWVSDTTGNFNLQFAATSNFCSIDTSFQITVNNLPLVQLLPFLIDTLCLQSEAIPLTLGTPAGGVYSGNGVTANEFDPIIAGTGTHFIYYSFTDTTNCSSIDSVSIVVEDCLGINEYSDNNITLFPNPFTKSTTIQFNQELVGTYDLTMYDVMGKLVYSKTDLNGKTQLIERNGMASGVYQLEIIDHGLGIQLIKRLVIE